MKATVIYTDGTQAIYNIQKAKCGTSYRVYKSFNGINFYEMFENSIMRDINEALFCMIAWEQADTKTKSIMIERRTK